MPDQSQPTNRMFVIKELEGSDGTPARTIGFTDVDIAPLTFDELRAAKLHQNLAIRLEMYNGTVVDTDIEGVNTSRYANIKTVLESPFTSRVIGLIRGGWLPSALAAHRASTTLLVDRNVVTEIVSRFEGGAKKARDPDFVDMFADEPVRINPLLYALEGNARAIPGAELVAAQLAEVIAKLEKALPKARLVIGPESLNGVLGLIEDTRAGMGKRERFLMALAPYLKDAVSGRLAEQRWKEVLEAADSCGVSRNSLVVLAALSSVAVPGGASPAKALLKFKDGYAASEAYNALADLRSLEILINLFALFPDEIIQLCTADKNLGLLWTGIRASGFRREGDSTTFEMDPVEGLLPGKWVDKWRSDIVRK